ncbi:MAG: flavodoxin family protein [Ruminococcaceae bacterium]|nr:flavodoxin family protein [Oscillospiraceae bacterium]
MNILVLLGSPNPAGNTAALCGPFCEELRAQGCAVRYVVLGELTILPCQGCYACQDVEGEYGCVLEDDMQEIAEAILWADCIVLACPIYSWYCPAQMKAVLDRHYGFNKFYGTASGSLWAGKAVALLLTHGYERAYATEPFVMGIERLAEHSGLRYLGMHSVQHTEGPEVFRTTEAVAGTKAFAREIVEKI